MALSAIFICGAECRASVFGTLADFSDHWEASAGTVAADTTVFDSLGGAASWKFTGSGSGLMRAPNGLTGYATAVMRLRFYVATGAINTICAAGSNLFVYASSNGDGTTNVQANAGASDSSSVTITEAAWHTLDVWVQSSGGTDTIKFKVDAGAEQTATNAVTSANLAGFSIGDLIGKGTSGNVNVDAFLLSATSADYPIGAGKVIGYLPNTTSGTHVQTAGDLKDNTSTNITSGDSSGGKVNEIPADTTSYVAQVVLRTTTYAEYVYNTTAETGTPRGVEQIVSFFMASAASGSHKAQLYDGTTATDAYATTGYSNTGIANETKCWAAAPSGAWTAAKFNTNLRIRWGFSGDITPNPRLSSTMLEAEFVAAAAAPSGRSFGMVIG